jgi:hypothetical protein
LVGQAVDEADDGSGDATARGDDDFAVDDGPADGAADEGAADEVTTEGVVGTEDALDVAADEVAAADEDVGDEVHPVAAPITAATATRPAAERPASLIEPNIADLISFAAPRCRFLVRLLRPKTPSGWLWLAGDYATSITGMNNP